MAEIEIEIDGQKLTAKPNQTVIQVADAAGIYIPRFCYHKHLSIPANCRMCLVEIEKAPKALPACATPVMAGMKVFTKSAKTIAAQRAVMEFLLINHPLDCPICDQGGECELQDLSLGYGTSWSHYDECKRAVADQNLGPLISTEMTRCIVCTRCVRFGKEIAGLPELGCVGRGEETEISTYVEHAMQSEVSGNIIDLCPVGALTAKPYRFTARAWELQQMPSISPHDALGSHLHVHTRDGKVMRVVPRENMALNETWLSDRDRFSYTGLVHPERLEEPMAKIDGVWQAVDWQEALTMVANRLRDTIAEHGADKIGALLSPQATVEEAYLLQKIIRGLGSPHIDHRLREVDVSDQAHQPLFPSANLPIAELAECDAIFLLGTHLQKELPLAALRVRKATSGGAVVVAVNPVDDPCLFPVTAKVIVAPQQMANTLHTLLQVWRGEITQVDEASAALVRALTNKKKICLVLGAFVQHHPQAASLRYLAQEIATHLQAHTISLTTGANGAGAWLAGAVPHRHAGGEAVNNIGLHAHAMLEKPRKAYLLLNVEPDLDTSHPKMTREALKQAKFVAAFALYRNPSLDEYADVILPITPFTETSGTYVNVNGQWQSFKGTVPAFAAARPAWKVLRVLGNFLELSDCNYESSEEILAEVKTKLPAAMPVSQPLPQPAHLQLEPYAALTRIGEIPIYAGDALVRHAQPLQQAQFLMLGNVAIARVHPATAAKLGLTAETTVKFKQTHGAQATFTWRVDERVAQDAVWIAGGIQESKEMGDLFGPLELQQR